MSESHALKAFRQQKVLEMQMETWRRMILLHRPTANADHVRTTCEEIVRRAVLISTSSALRHEEVAKFLLERSLVWVIAGTPIQSINSKLPKNLTDLGMLRIAEGPALSDKDLAGIRNVKRPLFH